MPQITEEDIENRFGFHKATIEGPEATQPQHAELREQFKHFANHLNRRLVDGRAKSLALTALEEASMWSHKAIAETAPLIKEDVVSDTGVQNGSVEPGTPDPLSAEAFGHVPPAPEPEEPTGPTADVADETPVASEPQEASPVDYSGHIPASEPQSVGVDEAQTSNPVEVGPEASEPETTDEPDVQEKSAEYNNGN